MASIEEILNKALNYTKLINPLKTALSKGTSLLDAPSGSWALSKDPKLNMALWNSIYAAPPIFGLAYLINNMANRKAQSEVDEKLDTQLIDKLQAMRPRLVADPNLADTSSFTDLPKKELNKLEELKGVIKKEAAEDEGNSLSNKSKDWLKTIISDSLKNVIPIGVAAAAASGGIALSNKNNKDRIKEELRARRVQLRNIQALIDRKMLIDRGLIKDAASNGSKPSFLEALISAPLFAHLLISGGLGIGTYAFMDSKDENKKKLKYLKKVQLGSNVLQDAPQLSVLDLPIDPESVLAVPGDKKQETLIDAAKDADVIDVKPIEDAGILQEIKKKDALFA